ncbi:nucleotidyl transferase AbiEii/AbiGii toxin family protein [Streptomyces sp. P38-E01]|uniref:Nucleotidyl transferase AbiEii/AbiGii toxin family protein n=1 Tax=Streptomyces tardus TaxID=2780544 RepID=A0A949N7Y6_9ACTN|nr:nucleotidyl transferase AbiEii/AbiGii toxin family protein [Streptomyces tardus]MBU7597966.1 nucleotidyl transferase AbiEii/AbiGii toxin family protein [Streptomyces tardus]
MNPRPTRATEAGRVYLDLQNLARRTGRPTDELHQLYVLECFLDRLVRSPYADRFVLKGGVLLAAYEMRRPTRDVDLRADRLTATPAAVLEAVREIAAQPVEDGVVFGADEAHAELIRDEDEYNGVRVSMTVELASARMTFHVDVNVGDPVVPQPGSIDLPRLRGGTLSLLGYPLAMVRAEKIITMLERGEVNTRWRDFADVYLLAGRHDATGRELAAAMEAVAKHRGVTLRALLPELDGLPELAQRKWAAWVRKQRLEDRLPRSFEQVLYKVAEFAAPALTGEATGMRWKADAQRWKLTTETT